MLVATDVASKGLDFPAIQHVVNYDMPEEIENYGKKIICIWLYLHHVFISSSKISQDDLTKCSHFSPQNRKNWTIGQNWNCHNVHQ